MLIGLYLKFVIAEIKHNNHGVNKIYTIALILEMRFRYEQKKSEGFTFFRVQLLQSK